MDPKQGDLLIRTAPSRDEYSQFVLLDAISERILVGPMPTLEDALRAAQRLTRDGTQLWQQFADDRGRPTGPMMLLGAPRK
jgi:hypothetical protein